MSQIVTPEFAGWLYEPGNEFDRVFSPGDAWDTELGWPDPDAMIFARLCFTAFAAGDSAKAKKYLNRAVAAREQHVRQALPLPTPPNFVKFRPADGIALGFQIAFGFFLFWLIPALIALLIGVATRVFFAAVK